jgi:hypothetical protein
VRYDIIVGNEGLISFDVGIFTVRCASRRQTLDSTKLAKMPTYFRG